MKKKKAVLVDLDGTLVNISTIRHFVEEKHKDFDAFHRASMDCPPNFQVLNRIKLLFDEGFASLILSGREAKFRRLSEFWIALWDVPCDEFFMRANGNHQSDVELKRSMFRILKDRFEIVEAIEDQQKIIDLWTELNIMNVTDVKNLQSREILIS